MQATVYYIQIDLRIRVFQNCQLNNEKGIEIKMLVKKKQFLHLFRYKAHNIKIKKGKLQWHRQ